MSATSLACPNCSAPISPDQRFCGQCGARLVRVCSTCGTENPVANRFCGNCGARLQDQPAPVPAAPVESARPPAAPPEERRWATVLFADLSGFTALSEQMDPEDVRELAQRCATDFGEHVRRFGGTAIQLVGDELLAVFGAPVAHEDDAERAVRAGLAIGDWTFEGPTGSHLQAHVGINTGEVMAGAAGPEERRDYTVYGDTVNVAARLRSAAPGGTVLVGEETYRATLRAVRYRAVAPVEAKGKQQPVPAWEALEAAPVPVARPLGTAPLVGRDQELALLSGIWSKVVHEAQPHLVTMLGDPGIGKSRLAAEFERQALDGATVIHGRCLPYGEAQGYWALAAALKEAAEITADDAADTARGKLAALVWDAMCQEDGDGEATGETMGEPAEVSRHLALLAGLDTAADRAAAPPDQRTLQASVRRFLEALARRRPVCLLLEDIHWADAALLDLTEFVAARAQAAPLLIVAQARPELLEQRPAWGGGVRAATSLSLAPLDEQMGQALVLALCRERGLPASVAEQVGRGAGGNPLFAEELVATLAERGGAAGIPSAIKALISARLDALPPEEHRAIQLASVLGKSFSIGGVRALGAAGDPPYRSGPEANVPERLEALAAKGLLWEQARSQFRGDRDYVFKHDLIRDVAYEMLPRAARRALHARAADWLEQAAAERVEEYLSVLAHHAVQAEQLERALDYLTRAAERARRAAAHREAAALFGQALTIAERLERRDLAAELRARRGKAFLSVARFDQARPELEQALEALAPEAYERRAEILIDLAWVFYWSQDTPHMRRCTAEAHAIAERTGREDLATEALALIAAAHGVDGNVPETVRVFREAAARAGDRPIALPARAQLSLALYWTGRFEEAIERSHTTVRVASEANDTQAVMLALPAQGLALAASGRYGEAEQVFDEAQRLGREFGIDNLAARAQAMSAGYHMDVFDLAGAESLAAEARERALALDVTPTIVSASIDLLLILARRGEVGRAASLVDDVAATVETARGWHGWLWQLRFAQAQAELALARGDWAAAAATAADALERSRRGLRPKYEVAALGTRARAHERAGRVHEAIADLRAAVAVARPTGDPAMLLRSATALLALDGDDALAAEARAAAERIAAALPDEAIRRAFRDAEPVRLVRGPS